MPPISENILLDGLLRLVAQQWAAFGVSIRADVPPEATIDPEALLWCTLEVGRYEPRLFDEVLDWLSVNHKSITLLRLRRVGPEKDDPRWQILSGVAHFLLHTRNAKLWRQLAKSYTQPLLDGTSLFLDPQGSVLPVAGKTDRFFSDRGFFRSAFQTKGQSRPPRLLRPESLLLRAKSLFQSNAKAYVWTALLTREGAFQADLADQTGYSQPQVSNVLRGFVAAGICYEERQATAKWYALLDREGWRKRLSLPFFSPWPNWIRLFRGFVPLLRTWTQADREGLSGYSRASTLRRAFGKSKDDIVAGRIPISLPTPDVYLVDEFEEPFRQYLEALLERCLFLPIGRTT